MITASKMISFNDGVAESLTIRVGEKNRQFKFSPDIDINDYDVKMVIIKPDNTFTITDCSIDDGFIIAAIPEQAAAVPGLGGYNIRVYDNDTNIYSAAGGVWVDDSLLNEELIESVAEVNGYVFPDDFFTTGDIEANPSGAAADALDKVRIFDTIYSIERTEPELSLDDLTDVTITDPENGEVLTRSGNNWINAALPDLPPVSKTVSGNPVEFEDGADAPIVKCVSAITGYQQGSGTPSPDNIRSIVAYTEGHIDVTDGDGNVTTHTTTFPSAIYRGSEDVVNGEVTSEWVKIKVSDLVWSKQGGNYASFVSYSLTNLVYKSSSEIVVICDSFQAVSDNTAVQFQNQIYVNASGDLKIGDWAYSDASVSDWLAVRGDVDIAYKLATPTTSSVTPTNLPIKSLSGYTHIESSTGDLEVEYITQHYEPIIKAAEILAQS